MLVLSCDLLSHIHIFDRLFGATKKGDLYHTTLYRAAAPSSHHVVDDDDDDDK